MAYFYPFGLPKKTVSASYATQAISASAASSLTITAYTASWAAITQSAGDPGPNGPEASGCGIGPRGPSGSLGPSGSQGSALTSCPNGSIECPSITPPSGYILVCVEIPTGCTAGNTVCPGETPPGGSYTINVSYDSQQFYLSVSPAAPVSVGTTALTVTGYTDALCSSFSFESDTLNTTLTVTAGNYFNTSNGGVGALTAASAYYDMVSDSSGIPIGIGINTVTYRYDGETWTENGYTWTLNYPADCTLYAN